MLRISLPIILLGILGALYFAHDGNTRPSAPGIVGAFQGVLSSAPDPAQPKPDSKADAASPVVNGVAAFDLSKERAPVFSAEAFALADPDNEDANAASRLSTEDPSASGRAYSQDEGMGSPDFGIRGQGSSGYSGSGHWNGGGAGPGGGSSGGGSGGSDNGGFNALASQLMNLAAFRQSTPSSPGSSNESSPGSGNDSPSTPGSSTGSSGSGGGSPSSPQAASTLPASGGPAGGFPGLDTPSDGTGGPANDAGGLPSVTGDPTTGTGAPAAGDPVPTPEPSTFILGGLGLMWLALVRRRRAVRA